MPVSAAPRGDAGHHHHNHDRHRERGAVAPARSGSLLRASVAQRLGFVGVALAVLWAAVFWVMA